MRAGQSVHPLARDEIREAILYYRDGSPVVAFEFIEIYEAAVRAILDFPRSNPLIIDKYRRKVIRKFPYSIIYTFTDTEVRILAVAHQKRKPFYWLDRS